MSEVLLPVAFSLFAWWFGTGIVFLLEPAARRGGKRAMVLVGAAAAVALTGIGHASRMATAAGAYLGFASSVALWGAIEIGFLSGRIVGPRRHPCPPGCHGPRHFLHAVEALLHHEIALLLGGVAVAVASWGHPNLAGAWTFAVLWTMRASAKINLHLGVRNPGEHLLPPQLSHLRCYFARRPINLFFPFTVSAATAAAALMVQEILMRPPDAIRCGLLLVVTLLVLAIVEHWLLVLPLRADALWAWAIRRARPQGGAAHADEAGPDASRRGLRVS
ncbi:MAG TPA: putative photosynthetic complex assembly protein PuhE [Burkholderiaceae bacterium]|nr:putative photosynthetic complex assembly protein PuhE [Burkholderiaceae bacterium]